MTLALQWGAPLTVDDLEDVPDDGHRYELLEGSLLVTPAPGTAHQLCVVGLGALLLAAAGAEHRVLVAPYDWVVGPATKFQPDVLVARRADLGPKHLERTPVLVVEVLSSSTRLIDLGAKRLAYAAAGVPAYWVVDPSAPNLTVLRLEVGQLVQETHVDGNEAYEATLPFPVRVVPAELLA